MTSRAMLIAAVTVAGLGLLVRPGIAAAATPPPAMSATGAGHVDDGGGLRTFSFSAGTSGGQVHGQAEVDNRERDTRAHVAVTCLVVAGNTAYVGGTIDNSNQSGLVGAPVLFAVQDNGEGADRTTDQITGVFVGDSDCANADNQSELSDSLFPIQDGNIQVH